MTTQTTTNDSDTAVAGATSTAHREALQLARLQATIVYSIGLVRRVDKVAAGLAAAQQQRDDDRDQAVGRQRVERLVSGDVQAPPREDRDAAVEVVEEDRGARDHADAPTGQQRAAIQPFGIEAEDHRGQGLQDPDAAEQLKVERVAGIDE